MKEKFNSLCGYLVSLSAIVMILITVVDMTAFNTGFYDREYDKYDSPETLGVSQDDLMASTTALLDYLRDDRDDIVVEINLRGNIKEAFNSRETMHMEDVKNLYEMVMNVRFAALAVMVIGFIYLVVKLKQEVLLFLSVRFLRTALCFALVVAFLGLWALVDFTGFWTSFHLLFFRNDLWLLNPATDFMITMFPEQLFFDLVLRIVIFFMIPFALAIFLCLNYQKRERLHMTPTAEIEDEV